MRVLALVADALGGHGGIAEYDRQLLSSLAACEWMEEVVVLPRRRSGAPLESKVRVRQLSPVSGRLAYSLAALRAAKSHAPIHVVFCGHLYMAPLAAGIATILGVPLWIQVHGLEAWPKLSRINQRSIESAALVTSVSRYTRRRLLEWVRIEPSKVKVLPNTFDSRFRPGPKPLLLLDRHNVHEKKVLLTVSRLAASDRYKGHDRVIRSLPRVLAHHPKTTYIIAGDGDDQPRLATLAAECGVADKVTFAGLVSAEELPEYFRLADVLVMPSTGEGFGIVFLEALASGIDVLGGNQDGSVDPLCDGTLGTVVDPENEEEIALAICAQFDHPIRQGGRAGRFRHDLFATHLEALVRSMLLALPQYPTDAQLKSSESHILDTREPRGYAGHEA